MKRSALAFAALVLVCASAQASARWLTDFKVAQATACKQNKRLLVAFTGSDWCPACMRLEREVFSTPDFVDYAERHLVLVKADFPRAKPLAQKTRRQNEGLAERFGVRVFPTIVILNSAGKQLSTLGYVPGGVEAFIVALSREESEHGEEQGALGRGRM